jgi:tetratricopeptide (TPR) repeat protein
MKCRKACEDISRAIDDGLSGGESVRLERHLAACAECRALREDLRKIAGGAARLGTPEPSDKVWPKVRAALEAGAIRPSAEGASLARRPLFGLGLPVLRFAGAAALALILVASGLVIGRRLGREDVRPGPEAGEAYTLAKLDEAERYYQQAIKSLSEAFAAEKGALLPQVAELFDRNLTVIDATIQACRRAVLEEPDDLEARNYLLAAYTRKLTLLDSALDLQKRDRDAAVEKTII